LANHAETFRAAFLCLSALGLSGCGFAGEQPAVAAGDVYDPGESVNRGIFAGNDFLDRNLVSPVARGYRDYVPEGVRTSVGNFSSNLREPMVLANDMLQGNFTRAWGTTQRFVVNTTVGVVGLFDVAEDLDLPRHDADFGQTLGVWGVGPGPAVQLPLLGPSNARDAVGTAIGFVANPLSFVPGSAVSTASMAGTGGRVVDGRANLLDATDSLRESSLDYYASLRSIQAQRRAKLVQEGTDGKAAGSITIIPAVTEPALPVAPAQP
jgi:phospholipid-binding lipoprotein MlaA